jgi:hypothetical protein
MRTIEQIARELADAVKTLDGEQARRVIMLAQELAEAKALRLFELYKQAEEARRV